MRSLNKATIIGRLGANPEIRYMASNTAIAKISVATSDKYKDSNGEWQEKTEWHRVVAFGRLAEIAEKYLQKGSLVYIEGPIETRSWDDNGVTKYMTEIKALSMLMLDSKGQGQGGDTSYPQSNQPVAKVAEQASSATSASVNTSNMDDIDDDLPF